MFIVKKGVMFIYKYNGRVGFSSDFFFLVDIRRVCE